MNLNSREQIALREFTGVLSDRLADNYLYCNPGTQYLLKAWTC